MGGVFVSLLTVFLNDRKAKRTLSAVDSRQSGRVGEVETEMEKLAGKLVRIQSLAQGQAAQIVVLQEELAGSQTRISELQRELERRRHWWR